MRPTRNFIQKKQSGKPRQGSVRTSAGESRIWSPPCQNLIFMTRMPQLTYNRLMSEQGKTIHRDPSGVSLSLMKIDSSIRNGQFLSAHRELHKLYAELVRGEYGDIGREDILLSSLRKTDIFIQPMVKAYSQNQASIDIARRLTCQTKTTKKS